MRLGIFDVLFTTLPRHKVEIKKYEFKIVEKLVNSSAGMELPPEISDGFNTVFFVLGISFKYSRNAFSSPKERTWGSAVAGLEERVSLQDMRSVPRVLEGQNVD